MNAGTYSSVGSPRRRTKLWRAAALVAVVLFSLIAVVLLWLFSIGHSALPQIDGTIAVEGLSAPVNVTRDVHGVPTIDALTVDDLFFAQGYVTAQDRLFQMDLLRRASKGELAEIVGEVAVKHDRQQRILGIRATAEKAALVATPEDRDRLTAYARGINAYIESHRDHLPLEFRILRYSPAPWTLADSLAVGYQMVETLSTSPKSALTREKILAKLGPQLTADLYVNNSWRDHPPTMPLKNLESAPSQQPERSRGAVASSDEAPEFLRPWLQDFLRDQPAPEGSNNWVVSGAHTTTGKPLLSNDMHLGHRVPNLWYENHLRSPDFDVVGVSLPGYPYVMVGHNRQYRMGLH